MKTIRIELLDVKFFSHHGVFDFERRDGNDFIVNVAVEYETDATPQNWEDEIWSTISYAELFELVKKEMDTPRKLLETVALNISDTIKSRFPMASAIECRITKLNPPIPSFNGTAAITVRV